MALEFVEAKRKRRQQERMLDEARVKGEMPLDYFLRVMRDPDVKSDRRDKMAALAAPYCHPRLGFAQPPGKKDEKAKAAARAGTGTDWADDLPIETPQ